MIPCPRTDLLGRARSLLFVPASRPERLVKALASSADLVIVDLEDAVPAEQKAAAREALARIWPDLAREARERVLVRINAVGTPWHVDDLRWLAGGPVQAMAGVVVPKAEAGAPLHSVGVALGPSARLLPLVESLAGLDAVDELARTPQVARLVFGHLDFQLDLGLQCSPGEPELMSVRLALVAASRRASLPAPIDGVTANTADGEGLHSDLMRSRALGFTGKLCIHPAQLDAVNEAFSPTPAELEWARRVVAGAQRHGGAAFSLDGRMVDIPVVRLAERVLHRSG